MFGWGKKGSKKTPSIIDIKGFLTFPTTLIKEKQSKNKGGKVQL